MRNHKSSKKVCHNGYDFVCEIYEKQLRTGSQQYIDELVQTDGLPILKTNGAKNVSNVLSCAVFLFQSQIMTL